MLFTSILSPPFREPSGPSRGLSHAKQPPALWRSHTDGEVCVALQGAVLAGFFAGEEIEKEKVKIFNSIGK